MSVVMKKKKIAEPTMSVRDKFVLARKEMEQTLIEREEEITICLTALLCRQHTLLVGAPGTAKSLVVETIRDLIPELKSLPVQCCKDTIRNAVFGPVMLDPELLRKGIIQRNLEGGAADVDLLILEEVFKAGTNVLDMFLMLMNERVYREGLISANAPLKFILGASNEWFPEGCENAIQAFFDRFSFRKYVYPIRTKGGFHRLVALPFTGNEDRSHKTQFTAKITRKELDESYRDVLKTVFTQEAGEAFFKIFDELKTANIEIGNRRAKLSVLPCQAFAYLNGSDTVEIEHLEILKYILWSNPNQAKDVSKIIHKVSNPFKSIMKELLHEMRSVNESITSIDTAKDAKVKLEDIQNRLLTVVAKTTAQKNIIDDAAGELGVYKKHAMLRAEGVVIPKTLEEEMTEYQ